MPKVAILSPFYKRPDAVGITVKSIQAQTFTDFEAIIWDDCSPDTTWAVLESVVSSLNDSRFIVFKNKSNLGLTQGLNRAFQMTGAEYVAIVGSGDCCHRDRIEKQVRALDEHQDALFCATDSSTIDPLTGRVFSDHAYKKIHIYAEDLIGSVPFTHGSVMYRRSAVMEAGGYEPVFKWCADWDLFHRLLKRGYGIYIPEVLYDRYAREDGASYDPEKSASQIEYKYLARLLNIVKTKQEREKMVALASNDLDVALAPFKKKIQHDIWKREIKLLLMRRYQKAKNIRKLAEKKYGRSFSRRLGSILATGVSYFPVSLSFSINAARWLSRRLTG